MSIGRLTIVALGVVVFGTSSVRAVGPEVGVNVNVVNTPSNPVPVVGSITLGGNSSSNPLLVRDVAHVPGVAFHGQAVCLFAAGQDRCFIDFSVPANTILLIETVSTDLFVQQGTRAKAVMQTTSGGVSATYGLPVLSQGAFGLGEEFYGLHQVRLYADGGSTVSFFMDRNSTASAFVNSGVASISGRLVPCTGGSNCAIQ